MTDEIDITENSFVSWPPSRIQDLATEACKKFNLEKIPELFECLTGCQQVTRDCISLKLLLSGPENRDSLLEDSDALKNMCSSLNTIITNTEYPRQYIQANDYEAVKNPDFNQLNNSTIWQIPDRLRNIEKELEQIAIFFEKASYQAKDGPRPLTYKCPGLVESFREIFNYWHYQCGKEISTYFKGAESTNGPNTPGHECSLFTLFLLKEMFSDLGDQQNTTLWKTYKPKKKPVINSPHK